MYMYHLPVCGCTAGPLLCNCLNYFVFPHPIILWSVVWLTITRVTGRFVAYMYYKETNLSFVVELLLCKQKFVCIKLVLCWLKGQIDHHAQVYRLFFCDLSLFATYSDHIVQNPGPVQCFSISSPPLNAFCSLLVYSVILTLAAYIMFTLNLW